MLNGKSALITGSTSGIGLGLAARNSKPSMAQQSEEQPLILLKPSHYDDDGYVIRWWRAMIPSNSLAALSGIAEDCARRQVPEYEIASLTPEDLISKLNLRGAGDDVEGLILPHMTMIAWVRTWWRKSLDHTQRSTSFDRRDQDGYLAAGRAPNSRLAARRMRC